MVGLDGEARERAALSAPESAVLMHGPKIGDRAVLALALKELVARGYLGLVVAVEPRRFGGPKRSPVLTPGPIRGLVGNAVLDAVLEVLEGTRPSKARSTRQVVEEGVAQLLQPLGPRPSLRETLRTAVKTGWAGAEEPPARTYPDGTVGVPVPILAEVVFRRYHHTGWIVLRTEGFVRGAVLPALVERGLYRPDRVPTSHGETTRAELEARLGVRRRASAERQIADGLRALAPDADALDTAFAAIDRGVARGWHVVYGD
ncbi:MAG: hypothetical protein QOF73_2064 [Thermomicrobiales bacterium]|jgi:hypothetical protein|nr:hypothetical protein [Thermomicrobiales bacterium]